MVNKKNIDNAKQNKVALIARDLARFGVNPFHVYHSLVKRGVTKWFAARRDLIKFKSMLRFQIHVTHQLQAAIKDRLKDGFDKDARLQLEHVRGYRKGLEMCSKRIKDICHSPRWQAADNDRMAQEFLRSLDESQRDKNND